MPGPLNDVDRERNLNDIVEYIPLTRPTVDQASMTSDLVQQHEDFAQKALVGLFLHTAGVDAADVRICCSSTSLGIMQRPYWRNRDLLFQQVCAWLFKCISAFNRLRGLEAQWELTLLHKEMPTGLVCPTVAPGENPFILAELKQPGSTKPCWLRLMFFWLPGSHSLQVLRMSL